MTKDLIYSFPNEDMVECEVVQRPSKRNKSPYVADVKIVNESREAIAHVPSLHLGGKCVTGTKCYMKYARKKNKNKDRVGQNEVGKYGTPKCELHSCLVEHKGILIAAHPKIGEDIANNLLSINKTYEDIHSSKIVECRREVSNIAGTDMRSDFLLTHLDKSHTLVEVKTVVDSNSDDIMLEDELKEETSALFPFGKRNQKYKDEKVVSARAIKHVDELTQISKGVKTDDKYKNIRTCVLFIIVRGDCKSFKPRTDVCPVFTKYLKKAKENGVIITARRINWIKNNNIINGYDDGNIPVFL